MKKPKLILSVNSNNFSERIPKKTEFKRWASKSLLEDAEIHIKIVARAEGQNLNKQFRKRNYATNVLTFRYPETVPLSADIALCMPVVQKEAAEQDKTVESHLAHLTVHAMLHAQGFDHSTDTEQEFMELMEIDILSQLGIDNPYE